MGKASRTKRERRAQPAAPPPVQRREIPVFWMSIVGIVVLGIVALVVTAPNDAERARDAAAAKVPAYAEVSVSGDALPTWSGSKSDRAEGMSVPELRGERFDGFRTTLDPTDGTARVYVVFAHWCPHCQAEVPRIVDWAKAHELPAGVEIVGISTDVDENKPNYPPAAWLAREQWPYDVLIDDEVGSAAEALGVEGFPFLVFADADGHVVQRFSGEMKIGEFATAVNALGEAHHAGHAGGGAARR
jgi:thiol-disulfide isomerase/thioredoxin